MISSARHGCVRQLGVRALSTFCPALPAESSRQAILRAAATNRLEACCHPTRCGRRKSRLQGRYMDMVSEYATAVAVKVQEEEEYIPPEPPDPRYNTRYSPRAFRPRTPPLLDKLSHELTTPSRPPATDRTALRETAAFRQVVHDDPIAAFLRFPTLDQSVLEQFDPRDFDNLVQRLLGIFKTKPGVVSDIGVKTAKPILLQIRSLLRSLQALELPSSTYRSETRFRGGRITAYFMLCMAFNAVDLAKAVFEKDLVPQIKDGINAKATKNIARFLISSGHERLLIELFSSLDFPASTINFPVDHLNARILEMMMQAHLRLQQPHAVKKLFEQHAAHDVIPTLESYDLHTQCLVQLGEIDAVKAMQGERRAAGWTDQFRQKLAIMRGQRTLGFDAAIERTALADLESLNTRPATQFLHALILLRLDRADTEGAKRLFSRFDLGPSSEEKDKVPPDATTLLLAFKTIIRQPDVRELRIWWEFISSSPGLATDAVTALLVRALCETGLADDAYGMVKSAMTISFTTPTIWRMPIDAPKPGIRTINELLRGMSKQDGIAGLKQAADLLRHAGVKADDNTLGIIVTFVRNTMSPKPSELSNLLSGLLQRSSDLRPTVGQLDGIMAEAVKVASKRERSSSLEATIDMDTSDPTAGLRPLGDLELQVRDLVQSLRDRGIGGSSKGFANRLRYEAMSGGRVKGIPSARIVWNQLIDRGYSLGRQHLLALMQGYADANSMKDAEDVLDLARETGVPVTRAMYMVLLIGWAKAGNITRSEHAYESIRGLGTKKRGQGLDIVAVTAMIKAFYGNGMFQQAVEVLMADLPNLNFEIDDSAMSVGATALLWFHDYAASLHLIRSKGEELNFIFRKVVRKLRVRLNRKIARGLASSEDITTVGLVEQTLAKDRELRPIPPPNERTRFVRGASLDLGKEGGRLLGLVGDLPSADQVDILDGAEEHSDIAGRCARLTNGVIEIASPRTESRSSRALDQRQSPKHRPSEVDSSRSRSSGSSDGTSLTERSPDARSDYLSSRSLSFASGGSFGPSLVERPVRRLDKRIPQDTGSRAWSRVQSRVSH